MKKIFSKEGSLICSAFISFAMTACQKEVQHPLTVNRAATISANNVAAIARSNDLVLRTFTHTDAVNGARQYHFVYSPNGTLDSIVVSGDRNYVYRIFYKGSHLDSVNLVQNNGIASTIKNFSYKGNLLSGFEYFLRAIYVPYPTMYSIFYDKQKRIAAIEQSIQNTIVSRREFSYDENDNVIAANGETYAYDSGLNPLHLIPDLFAVMVEEQWIWPHAFSLHNMTLRTYAGGPQVMYQNQYNASGQLAGTSFYDSHYNGDNTFSFTY